MKKIFKYIHLFVYCCMMNKLWDLGYNLYNWAEDRRPGGGFHIKNYNVDRWRESGQRNKKIRV